MLCVGGIGHEDEGFDFVGDVIRADAEVDAHEAQCVSGRLAVASLNPLEVAGGYSAGQREVFLADFF